MSQQRKPEPAEAERTAANAIDEQRILDATYELLLAVGIRRMTMADIARHADISRATLYRRWSNVQEAVAAVVTREFASVSQQALIDADAPTTREKLVTGVVRIVRAAREHPMLVKIIELDPEFLMPYLVKRTGRTTDAQLGLLEQVVAAGIADGSIREDDPAALARGILLTAWSFALTGPVLTTDTAKNPITLSTLDDQLGLLLDRYLKA